MTNKVQPPVETSNYCFIGYWPCKMRTWCTPRERARTVLGLPIGAKWGMLTALPTEERGMTEPAPDFIEPDAPREASASLQELTATLVAKISRKAEVSAILETLDREIWDLSSRQIPDAMDASGVDRVGMPELNIDVRLENWTRAVLPKNTEANPNARNQAVDWLVEHNYGDLIKTGLTVEFTRGEHNKAYALAEELHEQMPDKKINVTDDIHHMTYTAFIKERIKAGDKLPLDLLGATVGRVAKVVERKD